MQSKMAMFAKSRTLTLFKTLNLTKSPHSLFNSISTFSFLKHEPQLADDLPPPAPMPPNPASGSPLYNENWRSPIPISGNSLALIPTGFLNQTASFRFQTVAQNRDINSLKNLFADWMTQQRWPDMIEMFEVWIRSLDKNGKPNRPDVLLYNHYLRACLMKGSSAGEMLDIVSRMDDYRIVPNTASFNIVLTAMHQYGEGEAAQHLIERMLLLTKESQPDDESYNLIVNLLFRQNQIDAALKYIDLTLKSGYMLSAQVFSGCVLNCLKKQRFDSLVLIIEKCKAMDQNKNLLPNWNLSNQLAQAALRYDHSRLALLALEFVAKWIAANEKARPVISRFFDEGLVVSALHTASRTYDSTLLDVSWAILKRSLRDRKPPQPETYLAKIRALASLGNLQKAFTTLSELEKLYANSATNDEDDPFSPFNSLYPLVVACSKKGFETLDLVYFQLENLSRADPPYKSVAALNCVILGCANIWDLDRAYQTFDAISSSFGLTPNVHSYNALMFAFGRLKKTSEATRVLEHVCSLGLKPNAKSYSLIVDAHLVNRDPKAALATIDAMVEAGFEPSRETLKKATRRCIREMDHESNDQVASLARRFKLNLADEYWRNRLFNLKYSTESTEFA